MLEILVTIVILSFGLLGIAGLILTGLKNNHSATLRNQATVAAYDMLDRIRANREAALEDKYNLAETAGGTSVAGTGVQDKDKDAWLKQLGKMLPDSKGAVLVSNRMVTITVKWNDRRGSGETSDTKTFVLQTQI